jgi:hypothetical protein
MSNKTVFSEKDYNSGDGMLTSVWGPSMWHYLHTMSFNYPHEPTCDNKRHYHSFVFLHLFNAFISYVIKLFYHIK